MRLLAIDAGNTRVKWGLHDGREWLQTGVSPPDGIALLPSALTLAPDRIVVSNVAGTATDAALAALFPSLPRYSVRAVDKQCGVVNGYGEAGQLGSDRWAALIAVHRLDTAAKFDAESNFIEDSAESPILVVTVGTALTVDALYKGNFLGGIIVPGYRLMHTALAAGTAQLSDRSGKFALFPKNTADAISSGCLLALIGSIEQMRAAVHRQTGISATIWINGGDAALLAPHFPAARAVEENLVLTGLYFIALEVFV